MTAEFHCVASGSSTKAVDTYLELVLGPHPVVAITLLGGSLGPHPYGYPDFRSEKGSYPQT